MAAQWRLLNAALFQLPGDCPTITQREVVDGDGCAGRQLLFHVNGKVVECTGDPKSQDWQTMLQFAGRDVTLLHAQKFPNPDYPVPCGYAQIRDHHRAEIEAHFLRLVSDMFDAGHVEFGVVGTMKSWCSENDVCEVDTGPLPGA